MQTTQADVEKRTSLIADLQSFNHTGADKVTSEKAPKPESPKEPICVKFNYKSEPGEATRSAVMRYCQKTMNKDGWKESGCVICASPDKKNTVDGVEFAKDIECVQPSASRLRRLRFLDEKTDDKSDEKTDDDSDEKTVEKPGATQDVCAFPSPICETDPNEFAQTIATFTEELKDGDGFKEHLAIDDVNITSPPEVLSDDTIPNIEDLKAEGGENKPETGEASINVSSAKKMLCYYKLTQTTPPTFTDLMQCATEDKSCHKETTEEAAKKISLKKGDKFAPGKYHIYVGCTNDMPNSTKKTEMKSIYDFEIEKTSEDEPSDVNPQPISAGFINASFAILMILSMILI